MITEQHIQAQIIGFYRMGVNVCQITVIINQQMVEPITLSYVITTIQHYFKKKLL